MNQEPCQFIDIPRDVLLEHIVPTLALQDYAALGSTCTTLRSLQFGSDGLPLPPCIPESLQNILTLRQNSNLKGLCKAAARYCKWFLGSTRLHLLPHPSSEYLPIYG